MEMGGKVAEKLGDGDGALLGPRSCSDPEERGSQST
jgi:hypothetical protein